MSMVEFSAVAKHFGTTQVLHDINLKIDAGEVVVIIGPSGSGKSTLLRCINKLEAISSGTLLVAGMHLTDPHVNECEIRREAGMVIPAISSVSASDGAGKCDVWAYSRTQNESSGSPRTGAGAAGTCRPTRTGRALSVGAFWRPAAARGYRPRAGGETEMMLFDEPTSALDPELRHEVLKVMRSLADEGMTMIIVTHEIGFARDVASRLIFIDGGTIAEDGPPDILLNASSNPRLKEFLQHVS